MPWMSDVDVMEGRDGLIVIGVAWMFQWIRWVGRSHRRMSNFDGWLGCFVGTG